MAVLCPSCKAENAADARRCSACGSKLDRPRRRKRGAEDDAGSTLGGRTAIAAFRCTLVGLVPGLGLVLGPIGVVLALVAYRLEQGGPSRKGIHPALGVLALAAGVLVTSWVGVLLMIYGLTSAAAH
jgi:ribosomal protein L40E